MERYAQCARHVIVASSRSAQPAWRVWHELATGDAGEDAQPFQRTGHVEAVQAVVAMPPLDKHFHQMLRFQAVQVHAGG